MMALLCGQRTKKGETVPTEPRLQDSIQVVEGMGAVVRNVYEGPIPAADTPGQEIVLTLYQQEYAPSGVYHLSRTFIEAEDGKNKTFESTGTWETLSTDSHPIYVLTEYKTGNVTSFLYKGNTVDMLDADMNPIESEHNYTLVRRGAQNERVK